MAHEVLWTKEVLERFIDEAMLTKEEEMIIRLRVKGYSRVQQAYELGMSISSVDRIIRRLKSKYDRVQKNDPRLPKRTKGSKETFI